MASLCLSGVAIPLDYATLPLYDFNQTFTFSSGTASCGSYTTPSIPISAWVVNTCGTFWSIPTCFSTTWVKVGEIPGIEIWPGFGISINAQAQIVYTATTTIAVSTNGGLMPTPMFIQDLTFTGMLIDCVIAGININTADLADTNLYKVSIIEVLTPIGYLQEITVSFPSLTVNEIPDVNLVITMALVFCPSAQFGIAFTFNFTIYVSGYTFNQTAVVTIDLTEIAE